MKRRSFLSLVAAMPATAAAPIDVAAIKSRGTKKVEIVYKSPHTTPNGLQATRDGMWVADDRTVDGKNWIALRDPQHGPLWGKLIVNCALYAPRGLYRVVLAVPRVLNGHFDRFAITEPFTTYMTGAHDIRCTADVSPSDGFIEIDVTITGELVNSAQIAGF